MKTITVKPVPGGWAVDQAPGDHPLMFLTGGPRHQKARGRGQPARHPQSGPASGAVALLSMVTYALFVDEARFEQPPTPPKPIPAAGPV
jgi:hypothetical protein